NQGLLKPLPEDWETRWPNLARMVELTNLKDLIEVDGRVYIIPHAVYGNFVNLKQGMSHTNLFIRKDLLDDIGMEELGAEVVGKASLSQLREYLEKVAAAGLVENPTLGAYSTNVNRMFRLAYGINNNDFFEDEDGKMVWGPTVDGYVEMIQEIQDWYHSGLIDVDYYLNENSFYKSAFPAGTYAAAYMDGGAGNIQNYAKDFAETHSDYELGKYDFIQSLCITDEEGTPYARGNYNYWYAHVFSPNTDDATMERILDMMDYFSIKNVQIEHALGFEGENWEYDADGNVVPLVDDESLFPDDAGMFNTWGFCNDDFALSGYEASYDVEAVEICRTGYEVKSSGKVLMPSDRYESLSSAAKENYSVDIDAKITEIVVSGEDVETAWNDFIETNRNLWEPVLNELNAQ
ncbi:MAG: hypothetical protein IJ390_11140, partial [Lachnospiraceae bacterium]|nr:hypothetical protein [Lachnospiraceae bacterium]